MPSREEFLKWAVKSGFPMRGSLGEHGPVPLWDAEIEALCNRVWNEALERAAKWYSTDGWKLDEGDVPDEIRKLKQGGPSA